MTIRVNQNIIDMEYAVRGPIPIRAAALAAEGRNIMFCNIGNPQALGQKPLSYVRSVAALVERPELIKRERSIRGLLNPEDAISDYALETAEKILAGFKNGIGAYTESAGREFIRLAVAKFINSRDGFEPESRLAADPGKIILGNGAGECAKYVIDLLIGGKGDGIMIPIPQYPLYSAAIRKAGGTQVNYYPDEDGGWVVTREILEEAYGSAKEVDIKAIVVINPGNPTGAVLDRETIDTIVGFAADKGIAIIADEVYQENVYSGEFLSFASAVGNSGVSLFSLHSTSKGFFGECGHRGGYLEIRNPFHVAGTRLNAADLILKQASVNLCSNTMGQVMTYLMVSHPPPETPDHLRFMTEKNHILKELNDKATQIIDAFKHMDGVRSFGRIGAKYLFPRLEKLPAGTGDFEYCMALLEETGLCTVNGSGFGQRPGTSHLRIAFLPPKEELDEVLPKWIKFHNRYVNQ